MGYVFNLARMGLGGGHQTRMKTILKKLKLNAPSGRGKGYLKSSSCDDVPYARTDAFKKII
jgi:spore coat polysaccharide biosynthesis predicted glycosyltransferase SpsG